MAKEKKKIDEVTLILLIAIAVIIISFLGKSQPAVQEASRISKIVLNNPGIEGSNVIDEKKLTEIRNMDYQSLKQSLKANRDFCILIKDEKGNVILSKGSPSLNREGACVA